ncbi:glycine betaine reductase ATRR isoform X2 [Nematostella vectensis]|nr:glycine betaine reductase ATRR isoform X2 [Nematostella vectensis]
MDYEKYGCLHEIFTRQALKTPEKTAVVCDDGRHLNFSELNRLTDILASNLRHKGCGKDKVVGIYMERCLEYPIAYISALKAGGAYMPLELSYPENLLKSIFEDSSPVAIITTDELKSRLPSSVPVLVLSKGWDERLQKENKELGYLPPVESSLDDLAYVVYSSGTTGKPKGIACPHRGAVFSYTWRFTNYPYKDGERVACNVFFVWEMLRSLLVGIPLYVIPDDIIYDPPLLLRFLQKHKITRILFTPSLFEAILNYEEEDINSYLSSLQVVWLCGEVVTSALRDRAMRAIPQIKLLNLYSISECHDVAVADLTNMKFQEELPEKDENKRKFCPVGKLLPGVQIVIMDKKMKPLPVGLPGEIFVGGPTLARGYLNRPELNKERFISRPASVPASVGERLYSTGDWGYMLSSGALEICGRCDSMVKIRGYSIEIQAVEAALLQLPMINACVVLALGEEGTDKYLVAYVVPEGKVTKKDIRATLKTRLPFYMIPAHFVLLQSIPVAPSGKLDKKRLPPFDYDDGDEEGTPSTPTEKLLAEIWCEVLSLRTVDVQESFFDLGGHSLLATRLLSKLRDKLSINLTVKDLFEYPTIADIAHLIDDKLEQHGDHKYKSPSMEAEIDLKSEVDTHDPGFVNMDMILRAFWRSANFLNTRRWNRGRVLLTGATGFLGVFLLRDLLRHTKVHIFCVVRELPEMTCKSRLRNVLQQYKILPLLQNGHQMTEEERYLDYGFEHRVIAIKGDVSLMNLGMSEEDYTFLSSEIDFIIHAAASVNMVYPYQALRGPNVSGTQNALLFACNSKIKPMYYISTDAVFPHGMSDCAEDADMLQFASKLTDGYAQSKWVAEQLVMRARERGLPVTIYRLGNLAGDRKTARWNPMDFTLLMLKGCAETLNAPDVDWQVEMTPVDFVSETIVKMTQEMTLTVGKVFHLINPRPLESRWLFEWMTVHGYPLTLVPFAEWKKSVEDLSKADTSPSHSMLVRLLDTWIRDASFFSKLSTYSQNNFEEIMKHFQVSYPLVTSELLMSYIKSLVNQAVLPPPKRSIRGPRPLEGQVAIVTGASSGIGAAVAKALAEAGVKVALAARREER